MMLTLPSTGNNPHNIPKMKNNPKYTMKSRSIRTTLSSPSITAAFAAAGLLAFTGQSMAAVIFSHNFTGSSSSSLSGLTTTTGGGVWDGASDDAIKADGSFAGTGQKWLNWTPTVGNIYQLKVTINQTSGDWAGLLYKPTAGNPIWSGFGGSGVGTMLNVEGTWPSAGGIGNNGSGTYMITLDTTGANWTTSYFFNGIQKGSTYTWTTPPSINGVGIVTYNNTGTSTGSFSNFELSAVPEPSSVTLFGAAIGGVVLLRRRRALAKP
jgi:hypothetical protein